MRGGKLCAALDRQHPRDLFDLLPLMQTAGLADNIQKAFLVYALSHPRPLAELLQPYPQPLEPVFNHVPSLPAVRWKLHNIIRLMQQPAKHRAALEKLRQVLNV